jgi:DNA modification methylase
MEPPPQDPHAVGNDMITRHQIYFQDSKNMETLPSGTVDLVVTSPPYPMIEMWDSMFAGQNVEIGQALEKGDGHAAFEMMHVELDAVWQEVWRILTQGGIACINVGDATRTIDSRFLLYPNHSRILNLWDPACCRPAPMSPWNMSTS